MADTTSGKNNEYLSNLNKALIIQFIRKREICSRAELSKSLNLTGASISKIVSNLIQDGIVEEIGYIDGNKGRRSIGLTLKSDLCKVIGVKISRRSFSVGVFDIGGIGYDNQSEQIHYSSKLVDVIERIKLAINSYIARYDDIVAIGVSVPGPFNRQKSEILLMTEMEDWVNISLREKFEDYYKIPVIFEHDANAGALAEWWFGSYNLENSSTLVHFLIGEGIGAGVISKGRLLTGTLGIAGEIGHISIDVNGEKCSCGNYGCLEKYCSSLVFLEKAKLILSTQPSLLNKIRNITVEDILIASKNGDEVAINLVKDVSRYIGYGVVNLINAYNPDVIIMSNVMTLGGDLLLNEIDIVLKERLLPNIYENTKVVISSIYADHTLFSAASVAIDRFLNKPALFLNGGKKHV